MPATTIYNKFLVIILCISTLRTVATDKVKYDISWNPEVTEKLSKGKIFKHEVTIGEYMDIICPQYDVDEDKANILTFVIYNVTKDEFDKCSKINSTDRLLACTTPSQNTKLTLKFQTFSPNPRGFIYRPGETYYLMAYNPENEKESFPDCSNRMRMKIIVHPQHPVHPIPPLKTTTTTTKKITTTSSKFRSKSTETTTTTIRTTTQNDLGRDQAQQEASKNPPGSSSSALHSAFTLLLISSIFTLLQIT